jgi:4-amino-4-deoxy-L-arabinose transferase-like glycosyltransferase
MIQQGEGAKSGAPRTHPKALRANWRFSLALCLISLAAIVATSWITLSVFDGVPHDRDSVAYLFQAHLFASGVVSAPAPMMPEFFKEDFIVQRDGRWFGKYPPGHPLVLAIGVLFGAPWLVGPVLAGIAVLLLGYLGSILYGRGIGAAAALLLVTSPFFLFMSGSYLAHPTALALTLAALVLAWRLLLRDERRETRDEGKRPPLDSRPLPLASLTRIRFPKSAILLGLVLGGLLCTRQLTAVALGTCLVAWLICASLGSFRQRILSLIAVGLGAILPVLGLLGFQYSTTGSPFLSPQLLWWSYDTIGFGPGVGADGWHDPAMGLHDTWDRLTELQRHLFGWPFYLTLAPAMVPFILGRASRRDWWLLSIVAALVLGYVLYWNRGMAYGPRYYYEALGPLCLLSARGFQELSTIGVDARAPRRSMYGLVVALALVAFNVLMYLPQQVDEFRGYLGVDGRRARLVREAGIDRGLVFVRDEPRGSWQPYASVFWLNAPTLDGPVVFARDRSDENQRLRELMPDLPAYLLTQSSVTRLPDRS